MHLLLTGFEPFDGDSINASWEVARQLDGAPVAGATVVARCLPTAFEAAPAALAEAIESLRPQAVVALGQATGRAEVSMERVAVNLIDARIPDNRGAQPRDQPVRAEGPAAYFSTLPLKRMLAGLRAAGLPAGLSLSAGAFVCNQVFYELQHRLRQTGIPSGFIHLPALPEQAARQPAGAPSMALATQVQALRLALRLVLEDDGSAPPQAADEGAPVA